MPRTLWLPALLVGIALALAPPARADNGTPLSADKLDQLVSPIALYPDDLLAQILMASTYPLEIVEADRWVKANPNLKGKALESGLSKQTWDPSVSSLTAFPDILSRMSQNLNWTNDIGEAFLSQQADVMAAVQRMRARAKAAGNLQTTPQETVSNQGTNIIIASPNPEVVYVPAYNPTLVYGTSWSYPTWYYPEMMAPWPGWAPGTMVAFGAGLAWGSAMFGGFNWYNHTAYVNTNWYHWNGYHGAATYNNINVNNFHNNRANWQYNNVHRQNVNFSNTTLQNRYGNRTASGVNRNDLRGYNNRTSNNVNRPNNGNVNRPNNGTVNRPNNGTVNRPNNGTVNRPNNGTVNRPNNGNRTQDPFANRNNGNTTRPSNVSRPSQSERPNAFGGYNRGNVENRASSRGSYSRQNPGAGFQHVQRSAPSRPVYGGGGRSFGGRRR